MGAVFGSNPVVVEGYHTWLFDMEISWWCSVDNVLLKIEPELVTGKASVLSPVISF